MKIFKKLFLLTILSFGVVACSSDDDSSGSMVDQTPTVVEAAQAAGLTTLLDAVGAIDGLDNTLLTADAITVFAPTNQAFGDALDAFGAENLDELVAAIGGASNLETVLGFHVVPAVAFSTDLAEGEQMFETLAGQEIVVTLSEGNVTVTDANENTVNVIQADVEVQNGVVHVIDGVLLPELEMELPNLVEAAEAAGLTTLLQAVTAVDGLAENLLNAEAITVFAPTNEAFENALEAFNANNLNELVEAIGGVEALESVLGFHVVPAVAFKADLADGEQTVPTLAGTDLTVTKNGTSVSVTDVNGSTFNVIQADVAIENGVVHVIDGVLLPIEIEELPNLVEAATEAGLTTLLDAVGAVDGLADALLEAEAITVFAPTNDAFADALDAFDAADLNELVEAIGGIENLETVLGFHVVPAVAFSTDLNEGDQTFTTLSGQEISVNLSGENVTVTDVAGNTANVAVADVAIENGVVHVIDAVLLPELPEEELPNLVEAATEAGLTTLLDAVGAVDGLAETLLDAEAITVFAPTNDAFADALEAFDADDLNELVDAIGGVDNLNTVLGFHVVPVVAFAEDLEDGSQTVPTLAGQDLEITKSNGNVSLTDTAGNTFNVITADVAIENGVVHVIDGVLLPNLD